MTESIMYQSSSRDEGFSSGMSSLNRRSVNHFLEAHREQSQRSRSHQQLGHDLQGHEDCKVKVKYLKKVAPTILGYAFKVITLKDHVPYAKVNV